MGRKYQVHIKIFTDGPKYATGAAVKIKELNTDIYKNSFNDLCHTDMSSVYRTDPVSSGKM